MENNKGETNLSFPRKEFERFTVFITIASLPAASVMQDEIFGQFQN